MYVFVFFGGPHNLEVLNYPVNSGSPERSELVGDNGGGDANKGHSPLAWLESLLSEQTS